MDEYELRAAIEALDAEAAGEPFSKAQKDRWKDLNKQLDEYVTRRQMLAELAGDPRRVEGERSFLRGPREDEAFAPHIRAAHDAGFRTIERHTGALSARAADQLDELVREGDPQGLGARYLAAVGDPAYKTAFGKIAMDPIVGSREWRGVASDDVTASCVAEATEATDGSPTLVQPIITTWQWRVFVPFSIELDASFRAAVTGRSSPRRASLSSPTT
jgi:hypothetical protein